MLLKRFILLKNRRYCQHRHAILIHTLFQIKLIIINSQYFCQVSSKVLNGKISRCRHTGFVYFHTLLMSLILYKNN